MSILRSKKFIGVVIFLFVAVIVVEITLRMVWGFGTTILYREDKDLEYIAEPNQNIRRFGHRVIYNEHSMRSNPLSDSDKCIVLGFGDSVINGGVLTEQDSLATSIVENKLNNGTRFLNISAGSWGPDNCAQYLSKYGAFDAHLIVLFVSSHDAHDNMTFEKVVGYDESYPRKQYPLAIGELMIRYVLPRVMSKIKGDDAAGDNLMINKNGEGFNKGFDYFLDYTQKNNIPFVICLHAERVEVEQGKFNSQGEEIIDYCAKNNITLISGMKIGERSEDFRDEIHINERGQKRWAGVLAAVVQENMKPCQ